MHEEPAEAEAFWVGAAGSDTSAAEVVLSVFREVPLEIYPAFCNEDITSLRLSLSSTPNVARVASFNCESIAGVLCFA